MDSGDIYSHLMRLSLMEKLHECQKMWDLFDRNKPVPFMNSCYYGYFMDCLMLQLPKSTSIFEVIDMIKNRVSDEEIESLFVINKLME